MHLIFPDFDTGTPKIKSRTFLPVFSDFRSATGSFLSFSRLIGVGFLLCKFLWLFQLLSGEKVSPLFHSIAFPVLCTSYKRRMLYLYGLLFSFVYNGKPALP